MSKLTQWLFCGILFLSSWLALIMEHTPIKMTDNVKIWAYLIPVFAVGIFGVRIFSAIKILYNKKLISVKFSKKGCFVNNNCV